MSARGSVPPGLELGQWEDPSAQREPAGPGGLAGEQNVLPFVSYAPPAPQRQMRSDAAHAAYGNYSAPPLQPYRSAHAYAAEPSQDPWHAQADHVWTPAEQAAPQPVEREHTSLDRPLEPLSERLGRLNAASGLELVHAEMLDRYAEAEAEQTDNPETDWYATRIAGARSWASMENSLDSLITDYEKRHHQANIYVAGGIGGAIVLTLIALSAFLTLAG